jgi:hypothetical protein
MYVLMKRKREKDKRKGKLTVLSNKLYRGWRVAAVGVSYDINILTIYS